MRPGDVVFTDFDLIKEEDLSHGHDNPDSPLKSDRPCIFLGFCDPLECALIVPCTGQDLYKANISHHKMKYALEIDEHVGESKRLRGFIQVYKPIFVKKDYIKSASYKYKNIRDCDFFDELKDLLHEVADDPQIPVLTLPQHAHNN